MVFIKPILRFLSLFLALWLLSTPFLYSQEEEEEQSFRKYDILPAISFSPETDLTMGIIGYRYLHLAPEDPNTTQSFINFLAVYTTKQQILIESNWEIFTPGNEYRFRGFAGFNRFPDRNYGLGNDAGVLVREFEIEDGIVTDSTDVNYLQFSVDRFSFRPVFLKKMRKNFYAGILFDIEDQFNLETLPDAFTVLNQNNELALLQANTLGFRSGAGFNFIWDSRDNLLNAREGSYLDLGMVFYGGFLGSDYNYSSYRLDARKYFNPVKNHSIALRTNIYLSATSDPVVPLRGLSRVGGHNLVRGYFRGTFQDRHLNTFEAEYRLPFWKDDVDAPLYKFWKRLGMVAFVSGAQVFGDDGNFGLDRYNYAVGTGLRILFNPESKVNIRIDYAFGLSKDSGGPGETQTGLYFFLAEAF